MNKEVLEKARKTMSPGLLEVVERLYNLECERFYGAMEIKFEAGRVILLRKTETTKPNNCRENRGEYNDQR